MCCIIHRLLNSKEIPLDNLERIIKKNPHGWGICWMEKNNDGIENLQVIKSMDMNKSIDIIRELEKENKEFLFHARWATHGNKDVENCHPFKVHNGVMFHNGKMEFPLWNNKMSDSWHFSFKVSKYLRKNKHIDVIVEKFKHIVKDCRLAFMSNIGEVNRFGIWHEIEGNFYSKIDWQPYVSKNDPYYNIYEQYEIDDAYTSNHLDNLIKEDNSEILKQNKTYASFDEYIDSKRIKYKIIELSKLSKYEILLEVNLLLTKHKIFKEEYLPFLDVFELTSIMREFPQIMSKFMFNKINKNRGNN